MIDTSRSGHGRRDWLAVPVFVLALALWLPTIGHDLVWDDVLLVSESRFLNSASFGELWTRGFWHTAPGASAAAPASYYRPVVIASLWVEWRLLGRRPWVLHLGNALLAALGALLAYRLGHRLVGEPVAAALGALLFAVHPAHVESVAFVSGRTDLWCALLIAAALLTLDADPLSSRRILAGTLLATLAALSKELGFLFPLLWLGWRWARREGGGRPALAGAGPALAAQLLALGAVAFLRSLVLQGAAVEATGALAGASAKQLALLSLGSYLRMLVLPWPHSAWHTLDPSTLTSLPALLGALAWIAAPLGLLLLARRRAYRLGAGWILLTLLPVANLLPLRAAFLAERYLYLPSLGLAWLLATWLRAARRWQHVLSLLPILLFAADSLWRSRVWRDDIALFRSIALDSPRSSVGWANLAMAELRRGRAAEAEPLARRALALDPEDALAWGALGRAQIVLEQAAAAAVALEEAARRAPADAGHWTSLGWARVGSGDLAGAQAALEQALRLDPGLAQAWSNLAQARGMAGDYAGAEAAARRAIALEPHSAGAHNNLGGALLARGRLAEASVALETALALDPASADALLNLCELARRTGEVEVARTRLRRWLAANRGSHAAARARELLGQLESIPSPGHP